MPAALASPARRRRTLRAQLLLGFVAVAAVPLLGFAAVAGVRLVRWADQDAARRLTAEAETVAERIDEYVEAHRREVVLLAAEASSRPARDPGPGLRRAGAALDGFLTLLVADGAGRIVAAHAPRAPGREAPMARRSVADRPYFRAPMATGRPFVSDAFRGRGFGDDPIVAVAAPVFDAAGRASGIVEGSLDLGRFARFARGTLAMPSARLVVVDGGGRVVYAAGAASLRWLQVVGGTPFGRAVAAARGREPVAYVDGAAGGREVPWVAAVARSGQTGWRVAVAQPRAAVRAAGHRYLLTIAAGIALAALLAVGLALRMAARVTRPLSGLVGALRAFDPRRPVEASVAVDAWSPAEVEELVENFGGMAARVHAADAAQRATEARFRAVFDHAAVGIAVHDGAGHILDANPAFARLLGRTVDDLRGVRAAELSPPEEAEVTRGPVRALRDGAVDAVQVEKRLLHQDGRVLTCELTVSRLDAADVPGGVVGMVQDVTERQAMARELAWRAGHDPLTGLANRASLGERLAEALGRPRAPGAVALLVLDLDEFKRVNDSLGHAEGDRLLCEAGRRLLSATRGCDLVARLGGDEFAVLLDGVDKPVDAATAAGRMLAALERPFALGGSEVVLGASLGIAYAEADDAAPGGPERLVRNADTAMYHAKHRGKGTFDTFAPAMHTAVADRLALEGDLRRALDAGEFRAEYQLIVDLAAGAPAGAECLLRWRRGGHTPVSPAEFIPVAEQTGLIVPIGRWVLREACRQGAAWLARVPPRADGGPPFSLTVNVSGRQLHDPALVDDVRAALADAGFDPRCLVLEITESVLMHNGEAALARLGALKALGVRLAIDDFGTGYSSLSYLQRLPVDVLKVDKSFVDGVAATPRDAALVRTVLSLADALGLRCVAEGVERADQRDALRALGCTYGQGYLFARPLPGDAAGERLAAARAGAGEAHPALAVAA